MRSAALRFLSLLLPHHRRTAHGLPGRGLLHFTHRCEVDLALVGIDAGDDDPQLRADAVAPAGAAADEGEAHGVEGVEIVRQRADVDEAGDEAIRQLDDEPVAAHIHDDGAEFIRAAATRAGAGRTPFS